ncbi:MAG: carboxypeptidase-like regulatory domain-containing protein [Erythrobacter sp.]|nr:carboxypeptidase-like regulatory domain-containing protein [Erythrobacter sp.]
MPFKPSLKRLAAALAASLALIAPLGKTLAQPAVMDAGAPQSASWQASEDDFLFLQLVIKQYKLTYDVRGYRTDRGVCLDLADVIQSLDLPIRIDKKSRRATGWLFAEDQSFTLDRDMGSVQITNSDAGTRRAPLSGDIHDTPEGWCVDTGALSRWFGVSFKPDLYNAIVRLESDRDMPFMQAIERRNRAARLTKTAKSFDLSQFPKLDMEYRPWRTPSVDVVSRTGVRIGGGTDRVDSRLELYAVGEALGASYFARLGTNEGLEPQSVRVRAYRNDPEGGLLGPLGATEVAAGDVETIAGRLTGQTAVGRGAFITNRPMGQTSRFAATTLRGVLPAGWDAELYRNGQLIAFQNDRGDGRYEFIEIDLFFGRNDLEVVLYGPQGQIRRERSSIPVGLNQIEPGQTYYWAGALQNDRDLFEIADPLSATPQKWRWGVGVERGLDKRTSAALGAQSIFFLDRRRTYIEGALARTFGPMQLELAGAHEFGAGSVAELNALGRIGTINFGANALATFGHFTSEFVRPEIDYRAGVTFDTSLRLGKFTLPIQGNYNLLRQKDGTSLSEFLFTTSATAGRVAISAQLAREEELPGESPAQEASQNRASRSNTRLRLLANTRMGTLRLRGNATFLLAGEQAGFETAIVRADKAIGERTELQGQVEYTAPTDEFRVTAGYTRRFDRFSLRSDAFFTTRGGLGANVQVAFSIGPDPIGGGLRITEAKLARNGQAAITVFRDDNGNGLHDPGEGPIKDVAIDTGLRTSERLTNEHGQIIVDDLQPFRRVLVGVDESSLADPFLAPAGKGIVITPRPGVMAELKLPVTPTGEVEGMLVGANGIDMPGVVLQLVDQRGNEVARTISEFDGFFLFERIPYGRYRLVVEPGVARKLSINPDLIGKGAAIEINRGQDVVRLGPIKLEDLEEQDKAKAIAAASILEPAAKALPN